MEALARLEVFIALEIASCDIPGMSYFHVILMFALCVHTLLILANSQIEIRLDI